jgi:hypothetical protein
MPQCGGKPCNFPDLPLLGYHGCAICRCELHGPCGIFFSEQSIKFQNVCHPCHRKAFKVLGTDTPGHSPVGVAGAKDASDEDSSASTDEASSEEQELGQSTDDCKVRATAEAAALKQAEKLAIKSFDFKAVTWQDVSVQYQSTCSAFDDLAFYDDMFEGINPSVKHNHSWSKLHEIFKVLSKDYEVVRENHKKSGNHDDFINFCNNKSEVYYLYLWLQQKLDVTNVVAYELPENVFCDSTANLIIRRPSPTNSYTTRQSLVESVNALVEARKPNAKQLQLTEEKLKSQVSKNRDDAMGRLLHTKQQLRAETDDGIRKILRKYEKKLIKELDFSSDSEEDSNETDDSSSSN